MSSPRSAAAAGRRTPAGQKFLAQLASLPQPLSGTFALPDVDVSGPLNALTAQADLSAGDLISGRDAGRRADGEPELHGGAQARPAMSRRRRRTCWRRAFPSATASADVDYREPHRHRASVQGDQ